MIEREDLKYLKNIVDLHNKNINYSCTNKKQLSIRKEQSLLFDMFKAFDQMKSIPKSDFLPTVFMPA